MYFDGGKIVYKRDKSLTNFIYKLVRQAHKYKNEKTKFARDEMQIAVINIKTSSN